MNLDELQSAQARERQSSDLQHLRSSFYQEVGEFIGELTEKRARAVEAADDPFSEPEVRRLSDDIETAEGTVEAIYERRVGKVVKKASIAAAGMPVEEDGLTTEEAALFDELVDRIEENRETVLSVLDGSPSVSCSVDGIGDGAPEGTGGAPGSSGTGPDPEGTDRDTASAGGDTQRGDTDGISAADLMGGGSDAPADEPAPPDEPADAAAEPTAGAPPPSDADPDVPAVEAVPPATDGPTPADGAADPGPQPSDDTPEVGAAAGPTAPNGRAESGEPPSDGGSTATGGQQGLRRATVRITADVGSIVGADDRDYDLAPEDVVTLPEPNADVLVEKDAAERL